MTQDRNPEGHLGLGVDVGGTNIKIGTVDLPSGTVVGDPEYIPTPQPATPEAIASRIAAAVSALGWNGPVGVAVPLVIHDGIGRTAANVDKSWIGCDVEQLFREAMPDNPVVVLNDADAAGMTEALVGAARGVEGLVILLAFGTGIGSALIHDGRLVPNSELGHFFVPDPGSTTDPVTFAEAEHLASGAVRSRRNLSFAEWAPYVSTVLTEIEVLLWPRLFVLGGGVSEESERWIPLLENRTPVVAASRTNNAGIVGAALFADGHPGNR